MKDKKDNPKDNPEDNLKGDLDFSEILKPLTEDNLHNKDIPYPHRPYSYPRFNKKEFPYNIESKRSELEEAIKKVRPQADKIDFSSVLDAVTKDETEEDNPSD